MLSLDDKQRRELWGLGLFALALLLALSLIPLAAFGLLNPLVAAAAMALSDVTVIGNALLLRRSKID